MASPAYTTSPSAAARTGVPLGAGRSIPSCGRPPRAPNGGPTSGRSSGQRSTVRAPGEVACAVVTPDMASGGAAPSSAGDGDGDGDGDRPPGPSRTKISRPGVA